MLSSLPEFCFVIRDDAPPGERVSIVKRGEQGFYQARDCDHPGMSIDDAKRVVEYQNAEIGVTPLAAECMLVGSMFGWDVAGADPTRASFRGLMMPDESAACFTGRG